MQYYGILGSGDAKKKVIEDSLVDYTDREDKVTAVVPWLGQPTGGMERVLDWLIDNDMPFQVAFAEGEKPPPRAVERAAEEVHEVRNPVRWLIKLLTSEDGDLLVLLDDEDKDTQDIVMDALDDKLTVLELNNGLVPLVVDEEEVPAEEEPEERPEPKEDTAAPLTEEEILGMTVAELRSHLKAVGVETTGLRKPELQELLLNGGKQAPEQEEPQAPAETNGHAPTATVVIVMPEGSTIVRQLDVRHLEGLLP